jgi:hypothetical protein
MDVPQYVCVSATRGTNGEWRLRVNTIGEDKRHRVETLHVGDELAPSRLAQVLHLISQAAYGHALALDGVQQLPL